MRTCFIVAGQILFFVIVSQIMNEVSSFLHLSIPGSILGIVLIFALLQIKVLRLSWIDAGAGWLLAEMLLFFIPSAVGMIQYKSLLLSSGLRILAVIACSTVMVMALAGLLAQRLVRRKERVQG